MTQDNDSGRVYVATPMSEAFKAHVEAWAKERGFTTLAKAGQEAWARLTGYDLKNEPEPKSRSKYGDDDIARQIAKMANSAKSALQNKLLRASQKAKIAKNTKKLAEIDAQLEAVFAKDWAPDAELAMEIREKAIERLIKDGKLPKDYDDATVGEYRDANSIPQGMSIEKWHESRDEAADASDEASA